MRNALAKVNHIGYVNEYSTMHYFGIPGHTQSIYKFFSGNSKEELHCGNVVNMSNCRNRSMS